MCVTPPPSLCHLLLHVLKAPLLLLSSVLVLSRAAPPLFPCRHIPTTHLSSTHPPPCAVYTTILSAICKRPPRKSLPPAPLFPALIHLINYPVGISSPSCSSSCLSGLLGSRSALELSVPHLAHVSIRPLLPRVSPGRHWPQIVNEKGILTLSRSSRRQSLRQGLHANTLFGKCKLGRKMYKNTDSG